ncbi:MAG: STAS domain-containing protein [Thermoplasmatota archaeon]
MELRKCADPEKACWTVSGSMDDDSFMALESILMNSQDSDMDIMIDVSGLKGMTNTSASGFRQMAQKMEMSGRHLSIVGATGQLEQFLRAIGLLE